MMKRIIYTLFVFLVALLSSCKDESILKPQISNVEIGSNNKTAYLGGGLHIEASILAEGKIANIRLLIEHEPKGQRMYSATENNKMHEEFDWKIDSTFTTKYTNNKNTLFHEHISIPSSALAGIYHLKLYVTDKLGNQTVIEEKFTVMDPIADEKIPEIQLNSVPASNHVFLINETISIDGLVTDNQGISDVYIGLVQTSSELPDSLVSSSNSITILHTHDFENNKSHHFTARITVGAIKDNDMNEKPIKWQSADYYILIKATGLDQEVNYSIHFPVKIQL